MRRHRRIAPEGDKNAVAEVELSQRLVEAGCPIGPLETRGDPLVYTHDGYDITLWRYFEPSGLPVPPHDYANALALLHAGMRNMDAPAPRFTDRVAHAQDIIIDPALSPELADADRAFLSERLRSLRQAIIDSGATEQLLHGEPHQGNVINTTSGAVFVDLETICRGPVEFDLAHVPEAVPGLYPDVDPELLDDCRELVLAMVAAWRWEIGDELPDGRRFGEELLRALRAGPPWPTLDTMNSPERDQPGR